MKHWWRRQRRRWRDRIGQYRLEWPRFSLWRRWRHWRHSLRKRGWFSLPSLSPLPQPKFQRWWRRLSSAKYWHQEGTRLFWLGMPAVLALLILPGIAVVIPILNQPIQTRYLALADNALFQKDYLRARIAFARLLTMENFLIQKDLYGLALSLRGLNQDEDAFTLLNALTSPNTSGYPAAHLYLAKTLLVSTTKTPALVDAARQHLEQAVSVIPKDDEANELLGQVYASQNKIAEARACFLIAEAARKEIGLQLAGLALQQGDQADLTRWTDSVIRHFQPKAQGKDHDLNARLHWAKAVFLKGDYPGALEILETGFRLSGKSEFNLIMGSVYAEWLKKEAKKSNQDIPQRLNLLQRGLECAPQNEDLLRELIQFSHLSSPAGDTARKKINALLAQGKNAANLHLALGLDAWDRGQAETAQHHFSLAHELAPNMPFVMNNMAMILCMGPQPDLPRALALIQSLLEKSPNEPHFRDTRGQIYFKLQRWRETVADLEFALVQLPPTRFLHTSLAESYRQLGMTDLAQEHQRIAQTLKDPLPELITGESTPAPPPQSPKK